jgi:hypothetical protein
MNDPRKLLLAIHEHFRHWNSVDPSAMFDENTTFKQAVEAYVANAARSDRVNRLPNPIVNSLR